MRAAPIWQTRLPAETPQAGRGFRLTVVPGHGDTFGATIEETYSGVERLLSVPVVQATPAQTARVIDTFFAALRSSGHAASIFSATRRKPITLAEPDGVRLSLLLLVALPVVIHSRVREIVTGINAMSVEETYYWYAKCIGANSSRARKALRVLLTSPERI
jgi:hypothetical protein